MDDDELVRRVAEGHDASLRALFDAHAPWLAGRLRGLLPVDAVEDVLQETFVAVWRGAAAYSPEGRVGGWLWGIARRQAALWIRRNGYREAPAESDHPDEAEQIARRLDLAQALDTLGGTDRELVRLLYEEDLPLREVARRLRLNEGTVKSRAHRVRGLLRTVLRQGET